ncbi:SEL1-like repeat protein [Microvirga terrestris]|uniref:SEL1-like repeat protein n=1 Tax=Microvirga terrestris TaxID=2791024 RepID=A0ABS0HQJ2_9HYPH|nr:SEL1-like repeat protein [Microvirga terrestris]MBF9195748.1 SEL1-like repeat protein [Microvirga terrestris]
MMRRPVLSRLDDLDARELAMAAARRAGLSLDDWAAAVLAEMDDQSTPSFRPKPRRTAGSDLETLIGRMSSAPRPQSKKDYGALKAAIAAENERQAQEQASRTAIALESMASWIEQAETRLNDAARMSTDQQERIVAILSQALSSLKERLDTVERRVAPRVEFPMEEALKALAPVAESLTGLRADMSRLATRLEQPNTDLMPAVETIRSEIDTLRSGMEHLATRNEIAALGASFGSMAKDLEQGPTTKDLHTLAGSMSVLYEEVQTLSERVNHELHRNLGLGIERITDKIDRMAEAGIDRSVIDFLSGQIVDLRQDLATRAEPQQMDRLSSEIEALGRQIVELRLHQVGKSDFTALKRSLDDVCSALFVTATAQDTSKVPELLESVDRRLDLLVRRPDPKPIELAPISEQLALLTERMANLSSGRSPDGDAAAEREALSHEPLLERFDRIEQELQQLGRQSDTADVAGLLRSIDEKLERTPAQPAGFDALERQVAALTERLESAHGEPLHKALEEAAGHLANLQNEVSRIAERAARAALNDIRSALPDTGDLDTLKHGVIELKALHTRSDRKTQETLKSVHEALEALASRLPNQAAPVADSVTPQPSELPPADRLEAAVRKLHAVTLSRMEETTLSVPDAPVHEPRPAEVTPVAASDADQGHVRASFIAAARRAAQNATPDLAEATPSPQTQGEGFTRDEQEGSDEAAEPPLPSLFERLRRTLDSHRRPLLLGLAFLVLAAGTAQILSGEHSASSSASATAPQVIQAPEAEAQGIPTAPAAKQDLSLFQPTSLAAQSPTPVALAAGRFLVDPATIGDIPAEIPMGLRQAALSGDAAALYEIGARLTEGRGVVEDPAAAIRLFERAAQAGLPPAQERLAALFEKGLGVGRDLKQAAFWYERAALGGHVRAMHNLATLLASGAHAKPDYVTALRWYNEAAEAGFRDSQFNTALLLTRGIGSKPNLPKAFQWFSLAAAQGDAEAARKRDELAARLGPADLKSAKAAVDQWRPRAVDPIANEPPAAIPEWTTALDRSLLDRS